MNKKYKLLPKQLVHFTDLTDNEKPVERRMYRLKALRDIPAHNIKAGDLGGWVNRRNILSHEGDCWIGNEAKFFSEDGHTVSLVTDDALITDQVIVYSRVNTSISIYQNAILSENVKLIAVGRGFDPRIHGEARLSDDAFIRNPTEITGKISGEARVTEASSVMGNAHVSGSAKISESTVSDAARVTGNAVVSKGSKIGESAVVTDDAKVMAAEIRGFATISGNAEVKEKAVICGDATVTDRAVISSGCVIAGESVIKDDAVVSEGGAILGKSIVSQDTVTGAFEKYRDYTSTENRAIYAPQSQKSLTGTTLPPEVEKADVQELCLKLDGLEKDINAYGNDIVKLLKFPIMSDLRDKNTLEMMLALKNSKNIHPESSPKKFRKAVNSLERKFMKAESNARIICATAFSDEQRKKADKARDLFAIACNEVSSEQEKKNAFKQGFRQLEGVVDVTDSAIENMRIRVGIPELEA